MNGGGAEISSAKMEKFKSKRTSANFEYPSDWKMTESEEKTDTVDRVTTIFEKNGKKIEYVETFKSEGGLGGRCDDSDQTPILHVERLAGTDVGGRWNVVEFKYTNETEKTLKLSTEYFEGNVVNITCEGGAFGWHYPMTLEPFAKAGHVGMQDIESVEFKYVGDSAKLSPEEKAEIVKILASYKV